ncbi:O-acetylhomoserine aminocarboxypropyltransferase/cysteine synthase family protein [Geosporobacter ferrireducens]|uniref:homocysteine desulfhydrase n=1 Tax=Geosporobacter ferrireducens TaxID=1424294 RepID=A0A1D8GE40_9FIRM|nr:aminotransferase class I/II-fold pyridoxal phosphate-dependent enzyme [Geosporobacter ferrireducens]AOT69176.1 acetyl-L-homoserine sulfhydrolase [Geosporobacter ferrireducens]MTI56853.1 O-acetylhomoserine aminocarboxypropyltransferase/cysteine synthase [Geosporobacter ferrireducens]
MEFQTKLIHGNWSGDSKTGATNVPLYYSNAFIYKSAKELENIFAGRETGYVYSRIGNPTVEAFEKRIAAAEDGVAAVATSSGMSAIYLAMMNILKPGDEMIASSGIFGGTYNLFKHLEDYSIHVKFLGKLDEETLNSAITDRTKVVFAETIGNPKLDVLDIETVSMICQKKNVIFAVDSTITSPYLMRPIEYGADIVIHSTSKYINGNSSAIGGIVVDGGSKKYRDDKFTGFQQYVKRYGKFAYTAKLRNEIGKDIGAVMSPMNSFLNLVGIESLGLRMTAHCQNAIGLAEYLLTHDKILHVNYPLLEHSSYYDIAKKYYKKGASAILTCRLGSKENAFNFIDNLKLISNLVNIGDARTLIVHPASTICIHNTYEEKEQMGVYEDLVRISVGIEELTDILEDIDQALKKV